MMKNEVTKSFLENHATTSLSYSIKLNTSKLQKLLKGNIHRTFQLQNSLSTQNMHTLTIYMIIARYTKPQEISDAFFPVHLNMFADQ